MPKSIALVPLGQAMPRPPALPGAGATLQEVALLDQCEATISDAIQSAHRFYEWIGNALATIRVLSRFAQ